MAKESVIHIRLPETEKARLDALAKTQGQTMSSLIRETLGRALKTCAVAETTKSEIVEGRDYGVTVRLKAHEKEALMALAKAMDMSEQRTLVALLRASYQDEPVFTEEERLQIVQATKDLKTIGEQLTKIVKQVQADRKVGLVKGSITDVKKLTEKAEAISRKIEEINVEFEDHLKACRKRIPFVVKRDVAIKTQ